MRSLGWSAVALCTAIVLGGCPLPPDPPGDGILQLGLELGSVEGSPVDGLENFALNIRAIEVVHRTDVDDSSTETRFELLESGGTLIVTDVPSREGEVFLVSQDLVPHGFIMQIRLLPARDAPLALDLDGEFTPVKLPSADNTGFKIIPRGTEPFEIRIAEITAVKALLDPARQIISNRGQGLIVKPVLPGEVMDPADLTVANPVTVGAALEATPDLEAQQRAASIDDFVAARISLIERGEVAAIVRGVVTETEATPVVEPGGNYEVATLVTMTVEEAFVSDVGSEITFVINGGALPPSFPAGPWPRSTFRSRDARLTVGNAVQAVLYPTTRDGVDVLLLYGGRDGVTPLTLPAGTPADLQEAVDLVLAHTEVIHG